MVVREEHLRLGHEVVRVRRAHVSGELVTAHHVHGLRELRVQRAGLVALSPVPQAVREVRELGELVDPEFAREPGANAVLEAGGSGGGHRLTVERDLGAVRVHLELEGVLDGLRQSGQVHRLLEEVGMLGPDADPRLVAHRVRALLTLLAAPGGDVAARVVGLDRGGREEERDREQVEEHPIHGALLPVKGRSSGTQLPSRNITASNAGYGSSARSTRATA